MTAPLTTNPSLSRWTKHGWIGLWLVLGILHLCSSIGSSGGHDLPGDLGDSRFNNLVLEHGYQALIKSRLPWNSPQQFHPASDTLGWSDTHVGTLPIYTAPRLLGASPERAMQFWFVSIAALNLIGAYRLLRELGVVSTWAAPLGTMAFAGVPWVWVTGTHAQILPIFPGIWTAIFALRFAASQNRKYLILVAGSWLGQFAAGPYLAFFVAGVLLAIMGLSWTLGKLTHASAPAELNLPKISPTTWLLTTFGALLGLINIWVYTHTLQSGFGRPMQDVINLTPTWASWFSASPSHRWWPTGWPGGSLDHGEHVMFGGFMPWLVGLGAAVFCWSKRGQSLPARIAIAGGITAALCVFTTVRWGGSFSIWTTLCEHIEPLRGFRAIGRIHLLVHSLLIIGFAVMIAQLQLRKRGRAFAAATVALMGLETWSDYQPSYEIRVAQERRSALIKAWESAGDKSVLVFAPGYTNQTDSFIHLDAWAAAMTKQRTTLNGYSGGAPLEHLQFIWNPNREKAESLLRHLHIPLEEVSFVERYDEKTARHLGFSYQDQRSLIQLTGFSIQPHYWELFSPIEEFHIQDQVYYQFTPPARVRFKLHDEARLIRFRTGMRDGAYTDGANSDGYDITIAITDAAGKRLLETNEVINPRDDPAARGFLDRQIELPEGNSRELEFRFGPGPSGMSPWDWPLLSSLRWSE
ncbi:MAG: hypothetical protein SynsKO_12210 [Synoicihabitans sp.]